MKIRQANIDDTTASGYVARNGQYACSVAAGWF